jgi:hypothetical protein
LAEVKKRVRKKTSSNGHVEVSGPAAMAVREFTLAHRDGHDRKDLEALRIYIKDLYDADLPVEGLHALVEQAKVEIRSEAVASEMESILFSAERPSPKFKLGSPFCPKCTRFKNYKKECPFCGHHEMTL